jgi:hypothetical protein
MRTAVLVLVKSLFGAQCKRLKVRGPVDFTLGITFRGAVEVTNAHKEPKALTPGVYEDQNISVS